LLVALYQLTESGEVGEDDDSDNMVSLVSRAFYVYHRYRVLRWVCEQTGEEGRIRHSAQKGAKYRSSEDEDTALRIRSRATGSSVEVDGFDPSYSLVHSLLARSRSASPSTGFNLLFDASEGFVSKLDLVGSEEIDLEPRNQDIVLAHSVLMDGHADTARRLTTLYPLSAGTAYVRGRAMVELGAYDEAVNLLKQAAAGCKGE
jgi:nuclear pore complex protein Nup160